MKNNVVAATTTKSAISSKKFAFTYDHINKKIVGRDIDFKKAGIPGSELEAELMARIDARPTYTFEIIETKKTVKQSYEGLTMELMESYLSIYEGELAEEMRVEFAKMKAKKEEKKMAFATI